MAEQRPTIPCGRYDWERMIREERMDRSTKLVALVFASFANVKGEGIFPGNDQLAYAACMSLATLKRNRDALVRTGWLTKVKHGNRHRGLSDEWRLSMPDLLEHREDWASA
ncbi:hypothetical protein GTV32_14590 [Gordonia sp. SID5947]|uniref:helix-turn-helix domain-containing protein n=1 Tax=Gordonia sp. SID5947 TaxID=2690315 RepID=UPI00136AC428|nr:helix-turn-helix domain-containing protein [Gordonia sp. SID5947]MYR07456.1 hypothetical protein [Gordonia sp. SID5947]